MTRFRFCKGAGARGGCEEKLADVCLWICDCATDILLESCPTSEDSGVDWPGLANVGVIAIDKEP